MLGNSVAQNVISNTDQHFLPFDELATSKIGYPMEPPGDASSLTSAQVSICQAAALIHLN